jgi:hypothetical protein
MSLVYDRNVDMNGRAKVSMKRAIALENRDCYLPFAFHRPLGSI